MTAPRSLATAATALALVTAPAAAEAASVRLHVQAPFDLKTKDFNLERIEVQNLIPVFGRTFQVPYGTLEPLLAGMLEDVVGRNLHFYIKCKGLGIDELCPDTTIDVKIHSGFKFTQKGQPVVTQLGPAKDNTFRLKLDAQARVTLNAAIHHETGIWYSGSETIDIYALIGAHAQVDLTLWPTPKAANLKVELTHDGGNISIQGLSEQIIIGGAVLGGALLGPIGAAFGALLGSIGADAAEDAIKGAIEDAITDQLNAANVQLRDLVRSQIDPAIAEVVNYQKKALDTPLPNIGMTVGQALAVSPASLDVRTRAVGGDVNMVVTTRFDPTPKGKSLQGKIRLPKTRCKYIEGGNKTVGHFQTPIAVEPHNTNLAGTSCAALISGASFARSTYLGESPEKLLRSGDPANALPSWQSTGKVQTSGVVVDKGDYYECPYTITDLPAAAILELATVKGTDLAHSLDLQTFRARFLFAAALGPAKLFDFHGKPAGASSLVFGGKGPKDLSDCPSSISGGSGLRPDKLSQLKDKFDPEKCPTCGLLDVFNHMDLVSNPSKKVELVAVPSRASITQKVDQVREQFAADGVIEGVQRIQSTLDGGLLTRSWAAVDKARKAASSRARGFTIKQVGPAASRKKTVKVLEAGKAVKLDSTHLSDAALPKMQVEVVVKGKGTAR